MPHKKGWHINNDKQVLRKLKFWHTCLVNKEKGVLIKQADGNLCQLNKGVTSQKSKVY